MLEPETPAGPLAPGSRYVFTRDSLIWTSALTVSDLLGSIPGVYIARGGWLGQPEPVIYGGRGAQGIELYWDGVLLLPLGSDSALIDPARIVLSLLRRVDVEVLPSLLRVYLVSERHERLAPRSMLRILSGAFRTGGYHGIFQQRLAGGLGVNVAAEFTGTEGASGPGRNDESFTLWAKFDWVPSNRVGASWQILRQDFSRDQVLSAGSPGVVAREGVRTDAVLRFVASSRPHEMGWRMETGIATSAWSGDTLTGQRNTREAFARVGHRTGVSVAELGAGIGDGPVLSRVDGRGSWMPLPWLIASGSAEWRRHRHDISSRRANAGLALVGGPFTLAGEVAFRDVVALPVFADDTLQGTKDLAARFAFETRPLGTGVRIVSRDGFQPVALDMFPVLPQLGPSEPATYVVVDARLAPVPPLTLKGWYSHPASGPLADLQPPHHARGEITFRSKFWRTFRSGAFDLYVRLAMESWSEGVAGRTTQGAPITLPSATLTEIYIQFEVVHFKGFWSLRNANNSTEQFVPGLPYARNAQTFGVKWDFAN